MRNISLSEPKYVIRNQITPIISIFTDFLDISKCAIKTSSVQICFFFEILNEGKQSITFWILWARQTHPRQNIESNLTGIALEVAFKSTHSQTPSCTLRIYSFWQTWTCIATKVIFPMKSGGDAGDLADLVWSTAALVRSNSVSRRAVKSLTGRAACFCSLLGDFDHDTCILLLVFIVFFGNVIFSQCNLISLSEIWFSWCYLECSENVFLQV